MNRVLITGSLGQIGSELCTFLRQYLGSDNVLATDIRKIESHPVCTNGNFKILDVLDSDNFEKIVEEFKPDTLIHLAALLSATAEKNPQFAWKLNIDGLFTALEISKKYNLKFFIPSSIAAFGDNTPKIDTPQDTIQRPSSMYGITKVSGELLCDYYHTKYGVDTRSLRLPGIISYDTLPGGGTTDYAVEIFYDALSKGLYKCYIDENSSMDMMYMPDTIKAIVQLLEAPSENLKHRNAYNVSAMSFTPKQIAQSIKKHLPNFEIVYEVDPIRQNIANSWPDSINSDCAKNEWGFSADYKLDEMVEDMLAKLKEKGIGC